MDIMSKGIHPKDLLVIGYYTRDCDYTRLAQRMKQSVLSRGLNCVIREMKSMSDHRYPKPMPWVMNCAICPMFIRDMMTEYPDKHLLYLDADATMGKSPNLFFDKPVEYDFAAAFLTNKSVENSLLSGTLFFKNTPVAKALVNRWYDEQWDRLDRMRVKEYTHPYHEAWDQQVLQDVLDEMPEVRVSKLPWGYTKIVRMKGGKELMEGVLPEDIVITQHQASRQNKRRV